MKVALINKNPAVSRLITLSLNKIGAEYIELEDASLLEENVDFIIIDSDVDASDEILTGRASKIMHLIPRGSDATGEICLEKPFLPTEFLSLFEQNKPQEQTVTTPKVSSDTVFHDDDTNFSSEFDSFEIPDIGELDSLDEPAELDISTSGEEFDIGNELDIAMNLNLSEPQEKSDENSDDLNSTLDEMTLSINDEAKIEDGINGDSFEIDELLANEPSNAEMTEQTNQTQQDELKIDDLNFNELDEFSEPSSDANAVLNELENMQNEVAEILPTDDEQSSKDAFEIGDELSNSLDEISDDDEIKNIQNALSEIEESEPENANEDLNLDELTNLGDGLDESMDEILSESKNLDEIQKAIDDELNIDELNNLNINEISNDDKDLTMSDINQSTLNDENVLDDEMARTDDLSLSENNKLDDELSLNELSKIDEIKTASDENLDEIAQQFDEPSEVTATQNDENLDEESFETMLNENQIRQDEPQALDTDEILSDEQAQFASEFKDELDSTILNANIDTTAFVNIDDITQNAMLSAFGLATSEPENLTSTTLKASEPVTSDVQMPVATQANEIATELKEQISKQISTSISASSIREALKGMNIKINISFEEN